MLVYRIIFNPKICPHLWGDLFNPPLLDLLVSSPCILPRFQLVSELGLSVIWSNDHERTAKGLMPEGHSITRPPFFNGTNYPYWKSRMEVFLRANDYEIWKVVKFGPYDLPEMKLNGQEIM